MGARNSKPIRVLLVGLDGSGKTSLLYQMKMGELMKSIPTIGFNVEKIKFKSRCFDIWDVGGQDKIRKLWKYYYSGTKAIVFVVDSVDRERMDEVKEELNHLLLNPIFDSKPLLIYCNKQDLEEPMGTLEVMKKLDLLKYKCNPWHLQTCSAKTGQGVKEGWNWLRRQF
jgi:small GTP-binding protein